MGNKKPLPPPRSYRVKVHKEPRHRFTLRIPSRVFEKLARHAEEEEASMSEIASMIIEQYYIPLSRWTK